MDIPDGHVSRSDIARLAGVRRPAVSNWERRHEDFPRPIALGKNEYFATDAVAAWLARRTIPANVLQEDETAGTTYGERFDKNAKGVAGHATPSQDAASAVAAQDVAPHMDKLIALTGSKGSVRDLILVFALICIRARRDAGWSAALRGDLKDTQKALWALDRPGLLLPDLGTRRASSRDLAKMAGVIEEAAGRLGDSATFRQVQERFAEREGKRGEQFYTPASVVRILVGLTAPNSPSEIYDPACGSGDLLVAAAARVHEVTGVWPTAVRGDALDPLSSALSTMNALVHGVEADVATQPRQALFDRPHAHGRAGYVITNPPFNIGDWGAEESARRFMFGPPPAHNANYAWLQHAVEMLAPGGRATVVMPNNASFSENPSERRIRAKLVEAGCVEGLVALPPLLFPHTGVAVTVWLLTHPGESPKDILLIDAYDSGRMTHRTRRELTEEDFETLVHVVEGHRAGRPPLDHPGIGVTVMSRQEIDRQDHNLNPRRYAARTWASSRESITRVGELRRELHELQRNAAELDAKAEQELRRLGW
ncbi:N-6 DNA methylase [Sphaerisporangium sp. NPDC004334]